ncbi:MAG: GDSL-type esterase/lipase family protein [Verrucomicrobiota bacterium]|nr:GDSL-type esterase/lipase family protein [Verrucomicrobiota bacterium]
MKKSILFLLLVLVAQVARAGIQFNKGDRVLFYGGSFIERLQGHGLFEASLQLAHPEKDLEFRSLAWTGDEVGYRLRPERYVNHLNKLLDRWKANVVILGFGGNESFAGARGIARFCSDLEGYLDEIKRRHPGASIVVLSPIATEDLGHRHYPDPSKRNAEIKAYVDAMREVVDARRARFVDLFKPSLAAYAEQKAPLTGNGIHLNDDGNKIIAKHLARELLGPEAYSKVDQVRAGVVARAVARKAEHVAAVVRPVNTVLYFGVRGRAKEYNAEIPRFHALIENADARIHAMAKDASIRFDPNPITLPPLVERKPAKLPSPDEMLSSFRVAEGYEVNLFASEQEFPELCNPEQIAFDARGRLWVVTMPSFPGTIPGDVPHDKVIVLEDTDRDGRADKSTVFADRLTVPDGLAFYKDGVIVSHQPRLVFMKDSSGDGKADIQQEILRGIDVTDAHHGGMIAMGPMGHVIFCDGVFHRSQIETPYGVTRGVDATTYRLDLRRGTVEREYQTLTPNPWKVTWDRWGNLFQMYGDGFVQDSHAIPWTPFGVYHPFRRAISIAYGKGSAACVISSPNFPDEYQQGMASAVLLRKCFVSISRHKADGAYFKAGGRLDVLSSPSDIFRPVDIAFGFDGAMYVSDFCTRIIGHAQNSMRDPRWDPQTGRIWRVVYKGKPVVRDWPRIEGAGTVQLLELLKHPQDLIRDHARRKLRHTPGVVGALDAWIQGQKDEQSILEGLWILHDQGEIRQGLLEKLLGSSDHMMRAAATYLIRFQAAGLKMPVTLLKKMARDEHPRVRAELIHTVSYLQQDDPAYASLLGQVDVADDGGLKTILADAGYGINSGKGPEIPVLFKPESSKLTHWLLREEGQEERHFAFGGKAGSFGTMRTFVTSPGKKRAMLSVRHSYVKVFLNGVPVIASANWWSSEWNVQVELQEGINQIEARYVRGRGAGGYAPIYLFSPLGTDIEGLGRFENGELLQAAAAQYDREHGLGEKAVRITAVPNQLAFSPREFRIRAGNKVKVSFHNPDLQIHNLVIVKPGSDQQIGLLADRMAQDPDAMQKGFVPDSDEVIWSTPLVNAGGNVEQELIAPAEPGNYPFICTFPGHWRVMKGVMVVY